jgi:hypothetical protein
MVFLTKTNDYQEVCDKNKNVIKMSVIIKGVYYIMKLSISILSKNIVLNNFL